MLVIAAKVATAWLSRKFPESAKSGQSTQRCTPTPVTPTAAKRKKRAGSSRPMK